MNYNISLNRLMRILGITIFLFFTLFVDFRLSIFHNLVIAYGVAFASLMMMICFASTKIKKRFIKIPVALWILSIVFVAASFQFNYIVRYTIGLLLLICFSETLGAKRDTVVALSIYGIIFAIFSFVFWLFPELYIDQVVPFLAEHLRTAAVTMIRSNRFPGLTGHYSTNGMYLAMGFGAVMALILEGTTKKKRKQVAYIALLLITGALLLIGKRAHLVFSIAAAFAVYWLSNSNNRSARIFKILRIIIIGFVLVAVAIEQIPMLSNTFDRFASSIQEGNFWMSRDILFAEAWTTFLKNPLLGNGWRSLMDSEIGIDAHNVFIQLLAETGIIGAALFFGLILYGVIIATKTLTLACGQKINRFKDSALLYFSTYFLYFFTLYCLTGNPLYDEQTFYVYMLSYGSVLYFDRELHKLKSSE